MADIKISTLKQDAALDEELAQALTAISIISGRLVKKSQPNISQRRTKMSKMYGLTGETVMVKFKKGDSAAYPWQGLAVPVLITGEYENFLVGEVLPHYAPNGFGLSHPYPVNIHKHDIQIGEMIIDGGSIK